MAIHLGNRIMKVIKSKKVLVVEIEHENTLESRYEVLDHLHETYGADNYDTKRSGPKMFDFNTCLMVIHVDLDENGRTRKNN